MVEPPALSRPKKKVLPSPISRTLVGQAEKVKIRLAELNNTMSDRTNTQPMRERLTKLFEFLKAYTDLRYPPVRDIAQQPRLVWLKDLPAHASVELFRDAGKSRDEAEDNDIALRLTRPAITQCPSPPAELSEWLNPGWQELSGKAEVRKSRNVVEKDGKTLIERFEADYRRPLLLRTWQQQREQWVTNERPARESLAFFQTVYEWYGVQEREGERIELLVGDGFCIVPMPANSFAIRSSCKSWNSNSTRKNASRSLFSENENSSRSFTWNFSAFCRSEQLSACTMCGRAERSGICTAWR